MNVLNPEFWIFVLVVAGIYAIFSLGLQLQFGYGGLLNFGHVAFRSGRAEDATRIYGRGEQAMRELADKGGRSEALSALAAAEIVLGQSSQATTHAGEAASLAREIGLGEKQAWAELTLARASGNLDAANRAVAIAEEVGDRNILFQALHCRAQVSADGDPASLVRAVAIIDELGREMGEEAAAFFKKSAVREVFEMHESRRSGEV